MRSDQERLVLLHQRAEELQHRKNLARMRGWCVSSVVLFVCLLGLTAVFSGAVHGLTAGTAAASSLLAEGAGGYVLAAVLAFMGGVVITVVLIRFHKKQRGIQEETPYGGSSEDEEHAGNEGVRK